MEVSKMFNNSRVFFTSKRAHEFAEHLELCEVANIQISIYNDGFGQKVYRVEWNEESDEE